MQVIRTTADQWGVQLPVREVLRSIGFEYEAVQSEGEHHAGNDSQIQRGTDTGGNPARGRQSWAGKGLGVRGPLMDETPLSQAEVDHGIEHGLIDGWPIKRAHKPVGAWEKAGIHLMAKDGHFDGLMA